MRFSGRGHLWFLIILCCGVLLRLYGLSSPQLWLDEIIQIVRFSHPSFIENLSDVRNEVGGVPLDYMVQSLFLKILGHSEIGARLHAVLFGCLSLVCFYWLTVSLTGFQWRRDSSVRTGHEFDLKPGLVAMFLLAIFPFHLFYSQEGRNYSLFFLLTLISFALLIRAFNRGGKCWWVLYSLIILCALYTNLLAVVLLLVQVCLVVLLFLSDHRDSTDTRLKWSHLRRVMLPFVASQLGAVLLFLPWLWWAHDSARGSVEENFLTVEFLLRLLKEISGGSWPLSIGLFLLFGLGVRRLITRRQTATLVLILLWLLLPVIAVVFLDWWRGYFFAIRQILFATPALLLGATFGLHHLLQSSRSRAVPVLVLLLLACIGVGTFWLSDRKRQADWKGLGDYLKAEVAPRDLIAAPWIERPVAFRYPQLSLHAVDLNSIAGRIATNRNPEGLRGQAGKARLYLIESRYTSVDQRRVIEELRSRSDPESVARLRGFRIDVLLLSKD